MNLQQTHMKFLTLLLSAFLFFSANGQVSLQTGAAQFSLPLYTYNDPNNRIGCEITLNYVDGNGLKVNEMASPAGTGWVLQFGGEITRLQNGEADDQYQPQNYTLGIDYNQNYYPNGYLYAEPDYHPDIPVKNGAAFVPKSGSKQDFRPRPIYLADREQDVFQFSFNGRSGEFVIGKNGSIQSLVDTKLKIEKQQEGMPASIRTTISGFVITDETGIRYVFKDRELSEVLKQDKVQAADGSVYNYVDYDPFNGWGNNWASHRNTLIGRGVGKYTVSKWFLSEIINPLTNQKISLSYEEYAVESNGTVNFQKSKTDASVATYSMSLSKMKGISRRIASITCSEKESVKFNYSPLQRQDVTYDKSLANIEIRYDNVTRYSWQFTMGYTGRNTVLPLSYQPIPYFIEGSEENPYLRLCLLGVQKISLNGSAEPPYEFTYNMGNPNSYSDRIPARFSFLHDHWGYSNAALNIWLNVSLDEFGNASPQMMQGGKYFEMVNDPMMKRQAADKLAQNGILKSVKYPAGGSLSFNYEQNTAWYNGTNFPMGGVRVRQTTLYDGTNHDKDIVTDYKYLDESGNSSGWGYEPAVYTREQDMTVYKAGGSIAAVNFSGVPSLMPKFSNVIINALTGGRIGYWTAGKEMLANALSVLSAFGFTILVHELFTLFSTPYSDFTSHVTYSEPINYGNTLPFQYKRVEVRSSAQADIGKTVYEFTFPSSDYHQIEFPNLNFPYANKQRLGTWIYGLPRYITVFDKSGNPRKRTENDYNPIVHELGISEFASRKWSPYRLVYRELSYENEYVAKTESDYIASDLYYPLTGHAELKETKEYLYNSAGAFASTSTKYFYNTDFELRQTETDNSKGEKIETYTYYPNDYNLGGIIQTMKENRMISVPIATQTFITKPSGKYLLSGFVNEYGIVSNGDIKLNKNHLFQSNLPVQESLVAFNPNQLVPNANYYKSKGEIQYNTVGLPGTITADSRIAGSMYDYGNKLVTATIVNASADEVAYTSFEAENKGGWNYNGQNIKEDFSPTGKNCYSLTANSCLAAAIPLDPSKKFILSFWCKGGTPLLTKTNGTAGNLSYSSVGTVRKTYTNPFSGWTYHEYDVSNTANLTVDNGCLQVASGVSYPTILMDEIRLYPTNARLSTTTYDPMAGKTSECDVNGRITYYEYDGLGRLKAIRDEERNVLKTYEYNYKQQ